MAQLPDGILASWAVAAGTLLLAIVAFYQARLLVKERKLNQNRELVDKIYLPLWREPSSWLEPDSYQMMAWPILERDFPHLTPSIPSELVQILSDMKLLVARLGTLNFEVNGLISKVSKSVAEKLGLHSEVTGGSGWTTFGILWGTEGLTAIPFKELWLSEMSLIPYVTQYAKSRWPGMEWKLDLRIDGQPVAGQEEAEQFAKEALVVMEQPSSAREYREKIKTKIELANKALLIIRKKMGIHGPSKWARFKSCLRLRRRSINPLW